MKGGPPTARRSSISIWTATSISSTRGRACAILANDGGSFRDVSAARGLPALTLPAPLVAAVAGDYDNDERTDLFVLGEKQHALLHQRADGTFEDTTRAAGIPAPAGSPATVAFVDADHDGDLDLVVGGAAPVLLRNNGNGTFADVTAASGIAKAAERPIAIVPTDVDNRRDVDLLIARGTGAGAVQEPARRHVHRHRGRRGPRGAGRSAGPDHRGRRRRREQGRLHQPCRRGRARWPCSPPATGDASRRRRSTASRT